VDQAAAGVDEALNNRSGAAAEVASQQALVQAQEDAVATAQAQLDDARFRQQQAAEGRGGAGIRDEDILIAQQQVDQAQQELNRLLNSPTEEEIAVAEAAVRTAQRQLDVAEEQQDAAEDCDALTGCPDEDVADAQVEVAEAQVTEARARLAQVRAGPTEFEVQSARNQVVIAQATLQRLRTGGAADPQTLALNVTVRQKALDQARAQLGQAQGTLQQTLAQQGNAEVGISASQAGLRGSQANLAAAQANQAVAQANLASATNPDVFDVAAAQAQVSQAQAQLDALLNPDPNAVVQAQAQVAQAYAQLEQAQANLAGVQRPFTDEEIRAQQALVDQARAQVAAARVDLDEATVRAPVTGVVSEKLVSEGTLVGQTTPIVTLVPPGLELNVAVEEQNLAQVKEGQPVSINVATYPGQQFQGTIRTVSPTVDPQSRTVQVKIDLQDPQGLLRPGMFAQLGIVTQSKPDALLVPRAAVVSRGDSPAVFVVRDGRAVRVPVKLGIADQNNYEVTEGLQEGELVVISGQSELTNGDSVVATTS
jgi:RND family efflux transporter MFP subunit